MIRTERLLMRRATWDDLDAVHRLLSDPRVMRYWSRPEHETLEETKAWLRFLVEPAADSLDLLVEKDGEVIVGAAGMGHFTTIPIWLVVVFPRVSTAVMVML